MWNSGSGGSIEETNLWLLFKCQVVNQWLVYDSTNTFLFLANEIAIIKLSSDKAEMTTFIAVFGTFCINIYWIQVNFGLTRWIPTCCQVIRIYLIDA